MDEFITLVSNNFFDKDGIIASKGKIDQNFVSNFFNDSFFKLKPPKSLDKNYFYDYLLDIKKKNYSKEDTLATLLELTKCSIINSLKFLPKKLTVYIFVEEVVKINFLFIKYRMNLIIFLLIKISVI